MRKINIGLRIEPAQVADLDMIAAELTRRGGAGVAVDRLAVARSAMERGIEAMKAEISGKGGAPAGKP